MSPAVRFAPRGSSSNGWQGGKKEEKVADDSGQSPPSRAGPLAQSRPTTDVFAGKNSAPCESSAHRPSAARAAQVRAGGVLHLQHFAWLKVCILFFECARSPGSNLVRKDEAPAWRRSDPCRATQSWGIPIFPSEAGRVVHHSPACFTSQDDRSCSCTQSVVNLYSPAGSFCIRTTTIEFAPNGEPAAPP